MTPTQTKPKTRLVVHCADKDYYIEYADLLYLEASGSQTYIHSCKESVHGEKLIVSKTLKELELLLPPTRFLRVHKSWLVHLTYVCAHDKAQGHSFEMKNKQKVPIAMRKLKQVLATVEQFDAVAINNPNPAFINH